MDANTTIQILMWVVLVAVAIGGILLMIKYKLPASTIVNGIDKTEAILKFVKLTVKDSRTFDNELVDNISEIIFDTLGFIKNISITVNKEDRINQGLEYVKELVADSNITLNEDEIFIVKNVLTVAYNLYESIDEK